MGLTISLSAQTVSSAEKDSKLQELEDVISLNSTQKNSIHKALSNRREQRTGLSHEKRTKKWDKKDMAFKKYEIEKNIMRNSYGVFRKSKSQSIAISYLLQRLTLKQTINYLCSQKKAITLRLKYQQCIRTYTNT